MRVFASLSAPGASWLLKSDASPQERGKNAREKDAQCVPAAGASLFSGLLAAAGRGSLIALALVFFSTHDRAHKAPQSGFRKTDHPATAHRLRQLIETPVVRAILAGRTIGRQGDHRAATATFPRSGTAHGHQRIWSFRVVGNRDRLSSISAVWVLHMRGPTRISSSVQVLVRMERWTALLVSTRLVRRQFQHLAAEHPCRIVGEGGPFRLYPIHADAADDLGQPRADPASRARTGNACR